MLSRSRARIGIEVVRSSCTIGELYSIINKGDLGERDPNTKGNFFSKHRTYYSHPPFKGSIAEEGRS